MAITILQDPKDVTPGLNYITYVVSSDNTANPNFRYIADIRIFNDATGTFVFAGRISVFPDVSDSLGIFRVDKLLKSYLTQTLQTYQDNNYVNGRTLFKKSTNSIIRYSVEFGEQYSDTQYSLIINYPALTSITDKWTWNGLLSHDEFLDYDGYDYLIGTQERKFLNLANNVKLGTNDDYYLHYMNTEITHTKPKLVIDTFDSTGTQLYSFKYQQPFTLGTGYSQTKLVSVNVGPSGLNSQNPTSNDTGLYMFPCVITPEVATYDAYLIWSDFTDTNLIGSSLTPFNDTTGYNNQYDYDEGSGYYFMYNSSQADYNLSTNTNTENFPYITFDNTLNEGQAYTILIDWGGDLSGFYNAYVWFSIGEDNFGDNFSDPDPSVTTQIVTIIARGDCKLRMYSSIELPHSAPSEVGFAVVSTNLIIRDEAELNITEKKHFIVSDCIGQYDNYRLRWLNHLGGQDMFDFNLRSKYELQVDRKEYQQALNRIQSNGGFGYIMTDKERTNYSNSAKVITTINSDWLSDSDIALMEDLVQSTSVYINDEHLTDSFPSFTIVNIGGDSRYIDVDVANASLYQIGDYVSLIFNSTTAIPAGGSANIQFYNKNGLKVVNIDDINNLIRLDWTEVPLYSIPTYSGKIYLHRNKVQPIILSKNNVPNVKKGLRQIQLTFEESNIKNTRR